MEILEDTPNTHLSKVDMNQKTEITKLISEILLVTMRIKDDFPEFYTHLDETPLSDFTDKKELHSNDFEEYLNTIQLQLKIISTF